MTNRVLSYAVVRNVSFVPDSKGCFFYIKKYGAHAPRLVEPGNGVSKLKEPVVYRVAVGQCSQPNSDRLGRDGSEYFAIEHFAQAAGLWYVPVGTAI